MMKRFGLALALVAWLASPARAGEYDKGVVELKAHLVELDRTLVSLVNVLEDVQIRKNRQKARIEFYSAGQLKQGSVEYDLKPEQPMTDAFVGNWTMKNEYVPVQMAQLLPYLRMPTGEKAKSLMDRAEANARELVKDLVSRKKKDGAYSEAADLPAIEALVENVAKPYSRPVDISQYLADQALMDRLLALRTKYFNQPVTLSKTIVDLVKAESAGWSVAAMRKTLFFIPVKKYFWQVVAMVEARQGAPMDWVMSPSLAAVNPGLYDMLMDLAKVHANQPVKMGQKVWEFVKANKDKLSAEEVEMCLHFTPDSSYAQKIKNLLDGQAVVGLAGFSPVGYESALLSTNTVSRLLSLGGQVVGWFERNPMGSPKMDRYYNASSELVLQRQDNSQGGERWLTPFVPIFTPGDNGAFVFSYFNKDGVPVGFARRSELTSALYFYDLEANLVGVSRSVLGENGQTQMVYAGSFYSLF